MCEMDSSSLCDVAFAMASGSSRGKGNTSLTHRQERREIKGCTGKKAFVMMGREECDDHLLTQ